MKNGPGLHGSPVSRALRGEYVPGIPVAPNPWFRQQEQRKEQREGLRRQQEVQLQAQRKRDRQRQDRQRLERRQHEYVAGGSETDGSVVAPASGEEASWTCSRCQAANRARAAYCRNCGEPPQVPSTPTEGGGAAADAAWHGETHDRAARAQSPRRTRLTASAGARVAEDAAFARKPTRGRWSVSSRAVAFRPSGSVWALAGHLAALGACIALVLLARLTHNYISYGRGFESLWDASRTGGDSSSPLREVDFRNLIALVVVCFGLLTVSLVIFRRTLTGVAVLVALLVIGQLVRFWLGLGPGWDVSHTVGASFGFSLAASFVIALGGGWSVLSGARVKETSAGGTASITRRTLSAPWIRSWCVPGNPSEESRWQLSRIMRSVRQKRR
jgi:hypothetical protein